MNSNCCNIKTSKKDCCKDNFRSDYNNLLTNFADLYSGRADLFTFIIVITNDINKLKEFIKNNPNDFTAIANLISTLLQTLVPFNTLITALTALNLKIMGNLELLLSDLLSCDILSCKSCTNSTKCETCNLIENISTTIKTITTLNTTFVTISNTILNLQKQFLVLVTLFEASPPDVPAIKNQINLMIANITIISNLLPSITTDYDQLVCQLETVINSLVKCGLTNSCSKQITYLK